MLPYKKKKAHDIRGFVHFNRQSLPAHAEPEITPTQSSIAELSL
jgi:hypothetical protein